MAGMIGQLPPGAIPPSAPNAAPPGGLPGAPPGGPKPQGGGGIAGIFQMLLTFLAGAGLDKTVTSLGKVTKLGQPAAAKPGIRADAAAAPNQTIDPRMAAMLAAKGGQQPSGSDDLVALLAKALQMQAGPGGGGGGPLGQL